MHYISNASAGICCWLGESQKIEIPETTVLVDCETGKSLKAFCEGITPGRTYRCELRWIITQSYNLLKTCDTREEAQTVYDDLVKQLAEANTVVNI